MRTWSEEVAEMQQQKQQQRQGQGVNGYGTGVILNNPVQSVPSQGIVITPKAIILVLVLAGIGWYVWKQQRRNA